MAEEMTQSTASGAVESELPDVAGQRGPAVVARRMTLQGKVQNALALGVVALVGGGFLAWYYSGLAESRAEAKRTAKPAQVQGEMKLPPLGPAPRKSVDARCGHGAGGGGERGGGGVAGGAGRARADDGRGRWWCGAWIRSAAAGGSGAAAAARGAGAGAGCGRVSGAAQEEEKADAREARRGGAASRESVLQRRALRRGRRSSAGCCGPRCWRRRWRACCRIGASCCRRERSSIARWRPRSIRRCRG